jgi:Fe-S cluster biogenesis protein NfuA
MITKISLEKDPRNPFLRRFLMWGGNTVQSEKIFTNVMEAEDDGCISIGSYLRAPYFEKALIQNLSGNDCLVLFTKTKDGWENFLDRNRTKTLEDVLFEKAKKDFVGRPGLLSIKNAVSLVSIDEMEKHLQSILPDTVKLHDGKVTIHKFENGELVILFGGACASSDKCKGAQSATQAHITHEMRVEYVQQIKNVTYVMAP